MFFFRSPEWSDSFVWISGKKEQCPVCIRDFEKGTVAKALPCKHSFHKECIEPWLGKVWCCTKWFTKYLYGLCFLDCWFDFVWADEFVPAVQIRVAYGQRELRELQEGEEESSGEREGVGDFARFNVFVVHADLLWFYLHSSFVVTSCWLQYFRIFIHKSRY